jgi:hypothetical protein
MEQGVVTFAIAVLKRMRTDIFLGVQEKEPSFAAFDSNLVSIIDKPYDLGLSS